MNELFSKHQLIRSLNSRDQLITESDRARATEMSPEEMKHNYRSFVPLSKRAGVKSPVGGGAGSMTQRSQLLNRFWQSSHNGFMRRKTQRLFRQSAHVFNRDARKTTVDLLNDADFFESIE